RVFAFDQFWDSVDMADAWHPQTLLAYGMNGSDLVAGQARRSGCACRDSSATRTSSIRHGCGRRRSSRHRQGTRIRVAGDWLPVVGRNLTMSRARTRRPGLCPLDLILQYVAETD